MLNAAVLSMNDYERIKKNSIYYTNEEEENQKKVLDNQRECKFAKAREHFQRLKAIDKIKAENGQLTRLSELDKENIKLNQALLEKASKQIDENEDCVKEMNILVKFAKIAAVRDKQLAERKELEKIYKKKEEKIFLMMEIERLKKIKSEEEKDVIKQKKQRDGALVLADQIKHREQERKNAEEEVKKEGLEMVKKAKKMEEEDKIELEKQRAYASKMAKEIEEINKNFALNKDKLKNEERELDLKLLLYNIEKEKKEEAALREKRRLQEEKEKETQRLREKQEKFHDNQSELDAIRAKRAFEETDRNARLKEREELIARKKMCEELIRENEKQKLAKKKKLCEMVKLDEEEYQGIIKKQLEDFEREKKVEEERKKMRYEHSKEIMKQIKIKDENKKMAAREVLEEGRSIKQNLDDYYLRMNKIKQQKIDELKNLNVEQKYISDLEKYKIK